MRCSYLCSPPRVRRNPLCRYNDAATTLGTCRTQQTRGKCDQNIWGHLIDKHNKGVEITYSLFVQHLPLITQYLGIQLYNVYPHTSHPTSSHPLPHYHPITHHAIILYKMTISHRTTLGRLPTFRAPVDPTCNYCKKHCKYENMLRASILKTIVQTV